MAYTTTSGVRRKLDDTLWDETEIDEIIEDTEIDVKAWIDSSTRQLAGFSEEDLTGDDSVIRLAAECYSACRIMSEQLEGGNITIAEKDMSLASFRCAEARDYIRMWCANNDVIPAFDDIYVPVPGTDATTEMGASFAHAAGEDSVCI